PTCLMTRPDAGAVVAVKVFVKPNQIVPMRIGLELLVHPKDWTASAFIAKKDTSEPAGQLRGHFPQRHHLPRARRTLDSVIFAQVMMKLLQRFNDQIIYRKPDRASPIRVAAEQVRAGLRRLVVDAVLASVHLQRVRTIFVCARESAYTIRRKELVLVQHHLQDLAQSVTIDY